jgi:hypothetical protein
VETAVSGTRKEGTAVSGHKYLKDDRAGHCGHLLDDEPNEPINVLCCHQIPHLHAVAARRNREIKLTLIGIRNGIASIIMCSLFVWYVY